MRFKNLQELKQYEELYKMRKKRRAQIQTMLGVTPEKKKELEETDYFYRLQELRDQRMLKDIEEQKDELIEKYINEEVERRLKEQQPSEKQIEKAIAEELTKSIDKIIK